MVGHRLQRWPNYKPTLFQCVVFAGMVWAYNPNTIFSVLDYGPENMREGVTFRWISAIPRHHKLILLT